MKTLLLVDDEYAIVEALTALLEEEGYRVITAANGEEGLARHAEEHVDLVILDLMMPRLGGREMLRRMSEDPAQRAIPVILMSAALPGNPPSVHAQVEFLHKPFTFDALMLRITRLLPPG